MSQAKKWIVVESLLLACRLFLSTSVMPLVDTLYFLEYVISCSSEIFTDLFLSTLAMLLVIKVYFRLILIDIRGALAETEKRRKFLRTNVPKGLRVAFLADFFLIGIGGYPPSPPLNRKSFCPKKLSGIWGYPYPLTEKNLLSSFWRAP